MRASQLKAELRPFISDSDYRKFRTYEILSLLAIKSHFDHEISGFRETTKLIISSFLD